MKKRGRTTKVRPRNYGSFLQGGFTRPFRKETYKLCENAWIIEVGGGVGSYSPMPFGKNENSTYHQCIRYDTECQTLTV